MLYLNGVSSEKLALNSKAIHNGYIYIGPASLCPCPDINTPFLIITGDDNKYAKIVINKRSQAIYRNASNFKVNHGVIGKQATKKTWYTYNISSLNGVFEIPLIEWCNSAQKLDTLWQTDVKAQKLESYIQNSDILTANTINL